MDENNKITAEIKDPITGKIVIFEATTEQELDSKIENFFDEK